MTMEVVIVSAVRTAIVIKEALHRAGVKGEQVDRVY